MFHLTEEEEFINSFIDIMFRPKMQSRSIVFRCWLFKSGKSISTFTHFIMVIAAWATPNAIRGDTHKQIKYLVRVHKAIV